MTDMTENPINELTEIQNGIAKQGALTQKRIDEISAKWHTLKHILRPNEKDELLTLVDNTGKFTDLVAPRWLCHLLGLTHMSVHVLLSWRSPNLGKVFVLQVRNWNKSDSPGQLDISVGGHVVGKDSKGGIGIAYQEMDEELGLSRKNLVDGRLHFRSGYMNNEVRESENFYNSEWRNIFSGEINADHFNRLKFKDAEVVGLYLCPESQAENLLKQKIIPLASALRFSLPMCL